TLTDVFCQERTSFRTVLHSFPTRRSSDLAAVQVAESAEEWLEITSQIGPNGELLPRPEPQKFQFSRAKVLALLGQHRPYMLKKRSEEHTSELQSRGHLVCRLLLEKKN